MAGGSGLAISLNLVRIKSKNCKPFSVEVNIRFIGKHSDYDRIDCSKILKMIQNSKISYTMSYDDDRKALELITKRGTDLGNMDLLSDIEKAEYSMLATKIHEWEKVNYPLPVGGSVCA